MYIIDYLMFSVMLTILCDFFPCSLMDMQVACFPAGPMRKTMKKQMLYMQHWTRGWMKDAKKEGYNENLSIFPPEFSVNAYSFHILYSFCYVGHLK